MSDKNAVTDQVLQRSEMNSVTYPALESRTYNPKIFLFLA